MINNVLKYFRLKLIGFLNNGKFVFNNKKYNYFIHNYNLTWKNERTVELPIAISYLGKNKTVLEVGNVLKNYINSEHLVIDKYEKGKDVINKDINDFNTNKRFDLIICISTLEHVGTYNKGYNANEVKSNLREMKETVNKMKSLLNEKGSLIITVPIGFNKVIDKLLKNNYFNNVSYLEKISLRKWKQTNKYNALKREFNNPFLCANALAIITIRGESDKE